MAGSAWTNQVVSQVLIAGTVPGVLAYNPSIGAGNLIASVSGQQTTDKPLNDVVLAGITAYSQAAGPSVIATTVGNPTQGGLLVQKAATEAGPYGQIAALVVDTAGDVTLEGNGSLTLNAGQSGTGSLQATTAGGNTWFLPAVQFDISTHSAGNDASVHNITKSWAINAGDGVTGTTYTIKALVTVNTGQTTIETITLGANINGVQTALATLGVAFNGGALNTLYVIPVELVMMVDAVSAGTPEVYISGPLGDTAANRLSTNSANMAGFSHTSLFSGAAGGTFALYAQWGGAGGSAQNAQTIASRLYREGP